MVEDKSRSGTAPINGARAMYASKAKVANTLSVFMRLKRKRTDDPLACLLVESEPDSKRSKTNLVEALAQLSITEKCFVFKHIDTLESIDSGHVNWTQRLKRKARSLKDEHAEMMAKKHTNAVFQSGPMSSKQTEQRAKQQQSCFKSRRNEEIFKSRGLQHVLEIKEKQTMELHGIRLVDLHMSTKSTLALNEKMEDRLTKSSRSAVTVNGIRMKSKRVLNPYERELDEAIWTAFRANDFAPFFRIYYTRRQDGLVDPVAFQRTADGSNILMAAALHGRSDVIEVLLRSGTTSVLQQDFVGVTAAIFARRGGHADVEKALLACEQAEHEKDYVYDVYCVDMSASGDAQGPTMILNGKEKTVSNVPIISVSSEVHHWLSEDILRNEVENFMLESDLDSSDEDDGLSEDSNDEDNVANDYPDEESSDDFSCSSDGYDENRARHQSRDSENDFTERGNFDF
ncbi:uncharacterized protein CCR75_009117 [Bremia lactucae]|uniref:Probable RNA polymerase II nuclear localization protein SLC7A6OS n=1 Tax=Bremia lactucae TaxID=4779 RepID=A0A976IJU7_BRELC|nr:hypothetical protein CCR75_009117 [Bremia lactucae]